MPILLHPKAADETGDLKFREQDLAVWGFRV